MAADAFDDFLEAVRAHHAMAAEPWIEEAAALHDELVLRWEITIEAVLGEDPATYVVAGTRSGSIPITLEIAFPDGWFAERVVALVQWDGAGAQEVIDHDPRGGLLLRRPVPGGTLAEDADEEHALEIAGGVAERLWIANPGGIGHLAAEALEWARTLPARHSLADRPFGRALVHEAVGAIRDLVPTQPEHVLLHGDLRLETIVLDGEDRWVAVTPRPLIGEHAFDAAGLVTGGAEELARDRLTAAHRLGRRLDVLSERLGLDRERVRRWALAIATDYALSDIQAGLSARGRARADVAEMLRTLPPPSPPEPVPADPPLEPSVEDEELGIQGDG